MNNLQQSSRDFQIGIISINMYAGSLNFACPLHTFAFQQFLKKNGIESTVLDYRQDAFGEFDLHHPSEYYAGRCTEFEKNGQDKRKPKEYRKLCSFRDAWADIYEEHERRYEKFWRFIDRHYKKTPVSYDSDMLEIMDPGFDCYICCTDVIWRKESCGLDRGYFLGSLCMENKWKIAYAAGRGGGAAALTADEEHAFFDYLSDIDVISVREESTAEYIREKSGREVPVVLDPVLLHEASFYEELLIRPVQEHYLFLYYVKEKRDDTARQALEFARSHDLTIVEVTDLPLKDGKLSGAEGIRHVYRYDIGIEEWLGYIRYADYVFTNSFHCCCLSILFERQLFVGPRNSDKIPLLLARFGLEARRFTLEDDLITQPRPDIDFAEVRTKLQEFRTSSASFILSAIRTAQQMPHPVKDYAARKRQLKYKIYYNLGKFEQLMPRMYEEAQKEQLKMLPSGSAELQPQEEVPNDGSGRFPANGFDRKGRQFAGWRVRVRPNRQWLWILEDGSLVPKGMYDPASMAPIRCFGAGERIPYLKLSCIDLMVAEAVWEECPAASFTLLYNSGTKTSELTWDYEKAPGQTSRLKTGSAEYCPGEPVSNGGNLRLTKNGFRYPGHVFVGWHLRLKCHDKWYWLLDDLSVQKKAAYDKRQDRPLRLFEDGAQLPFLPEPGLTTAVLEAVWKEEPAASFALVYNSGTKSQGLTWNYDGDIELTQAGFRQYRLQNPVENDGKFCLADNGFRYPGHVFAGWHLRIKCHDRWYWVLCDRSVKLKEDYDKRSDGPLLLLGDGDTLPFLKKSGLTAAAAVAAWKKN